jgi:proteasome assembly chaperone (PAC2) family protein
MSDKEDVVYESKPVLKSPYVVCGMSGWVNGGEVSTVGVNYFIRQFKAEKFAEIPASRYHIYQVPGVESLRPIFKMQEGLIVDTHLPKNQFYYATNPDAEHDLIIFQGTEPSLYWEEYADAVAGVASDFKASRVYTFCGLLDGSPYTREPVISCTCTDAKVKEEMERYNVTFSNREGPATFNQMLIYACKKKGLEGVNFTVRVPCYPEFNVFLGYSPRSARAVLVRLKDLMHLDLNLDEFNSAIKELEGKLNFIRQQNPQFNTLIEELEKNYVEMPYQGSLDISPSDAVKLAEEFLKNNED